MFLGIGLPLTSPNLGPTGPVEPAFASGILTAAGQPEDSDTVTIGSKVYTLQAVLTDEDGNVLIDAGDAANSTYDRVNGTTPANGDTITIDGKVYTFQSSLTDVNGHVKVGVNAGETLDNFIAAVNLAAGAGTAYAASMTLHPTCRADVNGTSGGQTKEVAISAKVKGEAGNAIAVSETGSGSFSDKPLAGGRDPDFRVTLDSLKNAINSGGNGTTSASSTTPHPDADASHDGGADTMTVTAKEIGAAGNSIATTTTAANLSWSDPHLVGGA